MSKIILLAESSSFLEKIISSLLQDEGFTVKSFSDGKSATDFALNNEFSAVLSNVELKSLSGFQFCSILKHSNSKNNLPFILYTADENFSDFWKEEIKPNDFVKISSLEAKNLISSLKEKLFIQNDKNEISLIDAKDFNDNKNEFSQNALEIALNTMEETSFYKLILEKSIELLNYSSDLEKLSSTFLTFIHKISNFDVASIFLKNEPNIFFYTGIDYTNFYEDSFYKISKADFISNKVNFFENNLYSKNLEVLKEKTKSEELNSYLTYKIEGKSFIGTLNIATKRKNLSNYKLHSAIEYFCSKVGFAFEEALRIKKSTRDEIALRSAFSKFVPSEIIDDLIKSESTQEDNSNEKRKVAVMICDIRNFTSISEINAPENVVDFLNIYFSKMVAIIKSYGGTIDKFMGDAIMALFGAPISYVDNVDRCLNSALEMIKTLKEINCSLLKFPPDIKLDIGIGIHYGEVIVANIGCKDKKDYTAIGDCVNLASRLEGLTKQYGAKIIISESVKNALTKKFNLLEIDKVKVKGKKQGVKVYRADENPLNESFTQNYEKGLDLYLNGAFSLALNYFEEGLKLQSDNKACLLMKERCLSFMEKKVENWDGAISLTSK